MKLQQSTYPLLFLLILSQWAYAQSLPPSKVHPAARKAFREAKPDIEVVWRPGMRNGFEARFLEEGVRTVYLYDAQGIYFGLKKHVFNTKVPETVKEAYEVKFPNTKLACVYEITLVNGNTQYELLADSDSLEYTLRYTNSGKLLSGSSKPLASAVAQE